MYPTCFCAVIIDNPIYFFFTHIIWALISYCFFCNFKCILLYSLWILCQQYQHHIQVLVQTPLFHFQTSSLLMLQEKLHSMVQWLGPFTPRWSSRLWPSLSVMVIWGIEDISVSSPCCDLAIWSCYLWLWFIKAYIFCHIYIYVCVDVYIMLLYIIHICDKIFAFISAY